MVLYLIGLGLNERGISLEGMDIIKQCHRIYLENYTVDFPYEKNRINGLIGKNIPIMKREDVESERLIKEVKSKNVVLLVYGDPLTATTHYSLIIDCKREGIEVVVVHAGSVFDGLGETGLQLYKFGKTASMPKQESDFLKYVEENQSIKAHSLILVDIGLGYQKALDRLEKAMKDKKIKVDEILACSNLGNDPEIFYGTIKKLRRKPLEPPFCFVIPGELHFLEKETLEGFRVGDEEDEEEEEE